LNEAASICLFVVMVPQRHCADCVATWLLPKVLLWLALAILPGSDVQGSMIRGAANASAEQPLRCTTSACNGFGTKCKSNAECVTNQCYEGKCALSLTCRAKGEICRTFAEHTCCTGRCVPAMIKTDCFRLLGDSEANARNLWKRGINVHRQCENIGVCGSWPGVPAKSRGALSTPWAVPADDMAQKYWQFSAITFTRDVAVRTDKFIARHMGQTYESITADNLHPGSIRDAGVIIFSKDSHVERSMGARFQEGMVSYCVAPILREGFGGGYYAVGRDCCSAGNFTCGSSVVQSGLVVNSQADKYMQAAMIVLGKHGRSFIRGGRGLDTPKPIFVRMVKDYVTELKSPSIGFTYVAQVKVAYCVAPIWNAAAEIKGTINFWAVGTDCCSLQGGFHCGPVDDALARSGENTMDTTGDYREAVNMAIMRYKVTAPDRPMFVSWKAGILVKDPSA